MKGRRGGEGEEGRRRGEGEGRFGWETRLFKNKDIPNHMEYGQLPQYNLGCLYLLHRKKKQKKNLALQKQH